MTKPTTIRAMTDIPANTPNPIGNTWSFLPGKTNGVALVLAAFSAAAETDDGVVAALPPKAPIAPADDVEAVSAAAEVMAAVAADVDVAVEEATEAAIEVTP